FWSSALGGVIAGGHSNSLSRGYNVIGGGICNTNDGGLTNHLRGAATIGGGAENLILRDGYLGTIGGGRQNIVTNAGGTIAGGGTNVAREWGFVGGGTANLAGNYAVVSGGYSNRATYSYSSIGGGTFNNASSWSSVAGGYSNSAGYLGFIGGGFRNDSSYGNSDAIAGGQGNITEGGAAFIGAGFNNYVYGVGVIGGGYGNQVVAPYAAVLGGAQAYADKHGQQAHAGGAFGIAGDAQASSYILRYASTNASTNALFLDGSATRLTIASGSTWTFEILISARSNTGNSAGYKFTGVIENVAGNTAIVGLVTKTVIAEDVGSWDTDVAADNGNDALAVTVNGDTSTVRWVASVRTSEVQQ
ncbi:MAG TPA: hypothetical protein VK530_11245, partial [Candidatus Acidoferrum sp.]|nr:hypothetical protein [Candidatus Acidoferrum sp.]